MSREHRSIDVAFTVHSHEHLPQKGGEQMYADDVVDELRGIIGRAVEKWYAERGKEMLACEPLW